MYGHPTRKDPAMNTFIIRLHNSLQDRAERGAAMAEYGLLLVLVGLAAVFILSVFGDTLAETFGFAKSAIDEAPGLQDQAAE